MTYAGASHFERTLALETGAIVPDGIDLTYLVLGVAETFARMVRHGEFEASEMSLASYMSMVAAGDRRFVGLPIFPARYFRHRQIYVHLGSDVARPQDLAGKRVGVADYHQTAALWVRAFLLRDYGVRPESLRWVRGGLDRPGRVERLGFPPPPGIDLEDTPADCSLGSMLAAGELAAVIAPRPPAVYRAGAAGVARLFPDYPSVERDYYRRTGIFPIMHLVVVRRDVYEAHPQVSVALLEAFVESRRYGAAIVRDPQVTAVSDPWWDGRLEELGGLFGGEPFPYGLEANRHVLEAALRYAWEQRLVARKLEPRELFARETWDHPGG